MDKVRAFKGGLMRGTIISVNISGRKGIPKANVGRAKLIPGFGLEKDAHASSETHRQVSLMGIGTIEKMNGKVRCGGFGENLTIEGMRVYDIPPGTKLRVGESAILEITQIGKECHRPCAIKALAGECLMPKEGVFARVLKGGEVKVGDRISAVTS